MHRRSYYPHNQQIISTVTATSSSGVGASRPVTPGEATIGRGDSIGLDSHSVHGLPDDLKVYTEGHHHHHHIQVHDINEKDHV
jgi:serine/threonine kinase 32